MPHKFNAFLNLIILQNNLIQDFSMEKFAVLQKYSAGNSDYKLKP